MVRKGGPKDQKKNPAPRVVRKLPQHLAKRTAPAVGILEHMDARQTLDQYYLEMRWRCLSLAADLDRVERAVGGRELLGADPRLKKLQQAIAVLQAPTRDRRTRAEQVQMIFSDTTPPPAR